MLNFVPVRILSSKWFWAVAFLALLSAVVYFSIASALKSEFERGVLTERERLQTAHAVLLNEHTIKLRAQHQFEVSLLRSAHSNAQKTKTIIKEVVKRVEVQPDNPECSDLGDDWVRNYNAGVAAAN